MCDRCEFYHPEVGVAPTTNGNLHRPEGCYYAVVQWTWSNSHLSPISALGRSGAFFTRDTLKWMSGRMKKRTSYLVGLIENRARAAAEELRLRAVLTDLGKELAKAKRRVQVTCPQP
jgi:hypothetical protein